MALNEFEQAKTQLESALGEPILQVETTQRTQMHVEDDALRISGDRALEEFFG
jgi:hypothetical protein